MVEIITREFIQMSSSAGEVSGTASLTEVDVTPASVSSADCHSVRPDGAGKSQNSAQVHVDDEPGVAAGDLRGRRSPGPLHGQEEAAARTLPSNK